MIRIGGYQRVVLKGIARVGKQPTTISNGYSKQVKSLIKRKLVVPRNGYLFLTKKGIRRTDKLI